MRWELKTIHGPRAGDTTDRVPLGVELAELLDQGWEPIGILDRGDETWVFLRRAADVLRDVPDVRTIPKTIEVLEGRALLKSRRRDDRAEFDEKAFLRSRRRKHRRPAKGKKR